MLVWQVKALVAALKREVSARGSDVFRHADVAEVCARLRLDKDADALVDVLRTECYLLLKGPRMYQLQQ